VAFEPVTVKAYIEQVVLVHKGQVVATHRRSRKPGEQVLEPTHFLAAVERKPAYLDHTRLFKELKLPVAFAQLRPRLEAELGPRTGTRHYIRVLQLLGRYSAEQVAQVIEASLHRPGLRAEFIEQKLINESCNEVLPASPPSATFHLSELSPIRLPTVIVPPPDLRRFDQLLIHHHSTLKENDHVRDVTEAQSQDAAAADDVVGVCTTLA
jgi:hypothetical protein